MEFSQPRPSGAQGPKPTHNFLSLYSPAQQDPAPSIPDGYLKTHDFLQPLEQVGKNVSKYTEKSTPPSISYMNEIQRQKVAKAEGIVLSSNSNNNDENSNCSCYTGSGFTLSNLNKGKTRKENNITRTKHPMKEGEGGMSSIENNHASTTFSSLSSSHPSSSHKNRHFVDSMKTRKIVQEMEDNDEDYVIKKEPSFQHKGATSVKANPEQKPNSPRSKHSATEQRRRSKINDRFSMLRGIIPHGDQKRDKASFLLEVIQYIQFLQEKVHKYEDSSQGWTNQPPKTIQSNNRLTNGFIEQPQLPTRQNLLDSNTIDSIDATKETSQQTQPTNKPSPFPDRAIMAPQGQPQLSHSRSCKTDCTITSDKLKDQELIIESGTIKVSTVYSQGLSSALTQALKSSGVDLSHANISVQIDIGKRSNTNTLNSSPHNLKESGEGFKRLKTNIK